MNINGKEVIVIYSGRFQPMGRHHKMTYDWCVNNFGSENVFILTSDKVELPKSPLNFIEKQAVASAHGVPVDKFVNEIVPYAIKTWKTMPAKLAKRGLNYQNIILAFVVGEKDMGEDPRFRVGFTKSGSPTYFQHWNPAGNMADGLKHGYLLVAPHMEYTLPNGAESSGTNLRLFLSSANSEEFTAAMGFWDEDLDDLFKQKFINLMPESFKRRERGTKEYSTYLEDVMNELQHIKKEYGSRTKEGSRYRKEASIIQNSIRELNRLKKDHERKFEDDQMLSERLVRKATGYDDYEEKDEAFNRDSVRDFFDKFK